jgi:hypothetical protein
MLQSQTPESPQTFNHSINIRTLPFASNPMRAGSVAASAAHYFSDNEVMIRSAGPNKVWEDSNVPTADDLYRTAPVTK